MLNKLIADIIKPYGFSEAEIQEIKKHCWTVYLYKLQTELLKNHRLALEEFNINNNNPDFWDKIITKYNLQELNKWIIDETVDEFKLFLKG